MPKFVEQKARCLGLAVILGLFFSSCVIAVSAFFSTALAQSTNIPPSTVATTPVMPTPPQRLVARPVIPPAAPVPRASVSSRALGAQTLSCTPPAAANEIVELARALKWSPDLIYEYIHNNIATLPIYDSMKGPLGALIDQAGSPVDQAELMYVLLEQSCFSPQYVVGAIHLTPSQLDKWLGTSTSVPNNPGQFYSVGITFTAGGFCTPPAPDVCQGGLAVYTSDGTTNGQVIGADVPWIWITVPINGTNYQFDPASKIFPNNLGDGYLPYSNGLGAGLSTALGYAQSSFLSSAEIGASGIGTPAISFSSTGRSNLRNNLTAYASNLIGYISGANPAATTTDIIGGSIIASLPTYEPPSGDTLWGQTSLPYPNLQGISPTITGSLSAFRTTLTLTLGYNDAATGNFTQLANPVTLNSSDVYGRRLVVQFNASNVASILLDGSTQATASQTVPGSNQLTVRVAVTHPHLVCGSLPIPNGCNLGPGPNIDNVRVTPRASAIYVIGNAWGGTNRGMIEKHRKLLRQNILQGQPSTSEVVVGETLAMISYTWLAQYSFTQRLTGELSGTTVSYPHAIGIAGMRPVGSSFGPYVDLPLNTVSPIQRRSRSSSLQLTPVETAAFFGVATTSSVLESGTIEQTQPRDVDGGITVAASTIKLLDIWSSAGTIYDLNNTAISGDDCSYYAANVRSHLTNFTSQDLARIDSLLNYFNGACQVPASTTRVIVPSNGQLSVGLWTGTGYIAVYSSGTISTIITGGLSGGESGSEVPVETAIENQSSGAIDPTILQPISPPSQLGFFNASPLNTNIVVPWGGSSAFQPSGGDPVNLVTGSYVYSHQDLSVGSGEFPATLAFVRSYDSASGQVGQNTSLLGNGWMHNYDMTALPDSDGFEGMGQNSPINGAVAIAAIYVIQDILNLQTSNAKPGERIIIAAQVERWLMDQLTNNVVAITRAGSVERFVSLPNIAATVSYNAPFGTTALLSPIPSGGYTYRNKNGETLTFNSVSVAAAGKVISWTSPAGAILNFSYDSNGQLKAVVNPITLQQLNFNYVNNQLVSVDDNGGSAARTVNYSYDPQGNLKSFVDPLLNQTTYAYGGIGQLTQIFYPTIPDSPFITMTYDTLGRPFQQSDAAGNVTNLYFAGTRTEIDDPVNTARVSYFSARGKTMASIEGLGSADINGGAGNKTTTVYDGLDRPILVTMPEGGSSSYTYVATVNPWANNVTSITRTPKPGSPLTPLTTNYVYDPIYNKPISVTDPRGLITTMSYESTTGNLLTVTTDAGGVGHFNASTNFTYNSIGQVLTTTDPLGVVTVYIYDQLGNRTSITRDAGLGRLNQLTKISYDAQGNAIAKTDPLGRTTASVYDANRRLVRVISPTTAAAVGSLVTSLNYDPDGRLLNTSWSVGGTLLRQTSTTFTPTGKIQTRTDSNGNATQYTYDSNDRLLTETDPVGRTTIYAYDSLSRKISLSNPAIQSAPLVQQTYTPDGLAASLTLSRNNSTFDTTNFLFDGFDRLATTTYPNSSTEVRTYDADSNLLTLKTRAGATITFTYDTLNRRNSKAPPLPAPVVTYSYDLANNLIGVSDTSASMTAPSGSSASYSTTIAYDQTNRPIAVDWNPAPTQTVPSASSAAFTFGYDATNRRVSQSANDNSWWNYPSTAASVSYTANNLNQYTAVSAVTPAYDTNGNLTSDGIFTYGYDAENRLTSASGAGNSATYSYDAQGRRKSKTVNGTKTVYVTDADNREVFEYDGTSGATQNWYAYGLGSNDVLSQMNVAASTRTTFIPDVQGSIVGTLDASTGALTKTGFRPFGESSSTSGSFRYTAQRIDPETNGLYYYRARQYVPAWGRFMQVDPIGYSGGSNAYVYVENDPLNAVDPLGLWVFQLGFTVGGASGAPAGSYEVGIAIDSSGNIGTYSTAFLGVGAGVTAGSAASFALTPALKNIGEVAGVGITIGAVGGAGVQVGYSYTQGADLVSSYGLSLGVGAGASLVGGLSSTQVTCFTCAQAPAPTLSPLQPSTPPPSPLQPLTPPLSPVLSSPSVPPAFK